MGEAGNQDSMQISEDLKFVTACLIGQEVIVQTPSILLHGTLTAANLDKDYGIVLQLDKTFKMCLRDIVTITAEKVLLELDKDEILKSCLKENQSEVMADNAQSSAGQSGEDTKASQQHATSFASSTNTVPDQKSGENTKATEQLVMSSASSTNTLRHPSEENTNTTVLNATSMASSTITGIDQMLRHPSEENTNTTVLNGTSMASSTVTGIDQMLRHPSEENTNTTVQNATSMASSTITGIDQMLRHPSEENTNTTVLNATSMASSTITGIDQMPMMPIQPAQTDNIVQGVPIPYDGVQWQYVNAQGQLVPYVPRPYQTYGPHYPQAAQPFQGYVPHQVPGYGQQPQYPPQNFNSSYQAPGGYQRPR